MPQRTNYPCRHRGCRAITRDRSGYCDEHRSEASGWNDRSRGTAVQRGYGSGWRRLRGVILKRDKYQCLSCKAKGIVSAATDVDHIIPKAKGGTNAFNNLQSLCQACHKAKTIRERHGGHPGGG